MLIIFMNSFFFSVNFGRYLCTNRCVIKDDLEIPNSFTLSLAGTEENLLS